MLGALLHCVQQVGKENRYGAIALSEETSGLSIFAAGKRRTVLRVSSFGIWQQGHLRRHTCYLYVCDATP